MIVRNTSIYLSINYLQLSLVFPHHGDSVQLIDSQR